MSDPSNKTNKSVGPKEADIKDTVEIINQIIADCVLRYNITANHFKYQNNERVDDHVLRRIIMEEIYASHERQEDPREHIWKHVLPRIAQEEDKKEADKFASMTREQVDEYNVNRALEELKGMCCFLEKDTIKTKSKIDGSFLKWFMKEVNEDFELLPYNDPISEPRTEIVNNEYKWLADSNYNPRTLATNILTTQNKRMQGSNTKNYYDIVDINHDSGDGHEDEQRKPPAKP